VNDTPGRGARYVRRDWIALAVTALLLAWVALIVVRACQAEAREGPLYQVVAGGIVRAVEPEAMNDLLGFEVIAPQPGVVDAPVQRVTGYPGQTPPIVTLWYGPSERLTLLTVEQRTAHVHTPDPFAAVSTIEIDGTSIHLERRGGRLSAWWFGCDRLFRVGSWDYPEERMLDAVEALVAQCPASAPPGVSESLAMLARDAALIIEEDGARRAAELEEIAALTPFEIAPVEAPLRPRPGAVLKEIVLAVPAGSAADRSPAPEAAIWMRFEHAEAHATVVVGQGVAVAADVRAGDALPFDRRAVESAAVLLLRSPECPPTQRTCQQMRLIVEACERRFDVEVTYHDDPEAMAEGDALRVAHDIARWCAAQAARG
jgi:hypothetical protein